MHIALYDEEKNTGAHMLKQDQFVTPLLAWYDKNKREMVWRDRGNAYYTWISEIMLQQTRIEAAKDYFVRFTEELPDIQSLANVPQERLLKLWEGLGYYNRAKNLQKTAKILVEEYGAELPSDYEKLLALPGIGPYTAGAIASIAYDIKVPAVDGNVLRVTMRYLNCDEDIMKMSVRTKMEKQLRAIMPKDCPGEFNQALMELGEVICIPNGKPLCEKCPLSHLCLAHKEGREMELPKKAEKKKRRIEKKTVLVFRQGDRIGIVRRPNQGLLAGMWEFPSKEGHLTMQQVKEYLSETVSCEVTVKRLKSGKHIFSHVEWHMCGYEIILPEGKPQDVVHGLLLCDLSEVQEKYPIPVAFHIFLHQI